MHALLIHGAGGGGWEWNRWVPVLESRGIACLAPDLQPAPSGLAATVLDDYRRQVHVLASELPFPRVLIGASLGGLLAMSCAGLADALVLVNPLPPSPWSDRLPDRSWPDRVPWSRDARLASTRAALADADDATALFAFRHWRDESGAVLRSGYAGVSIDRPACPVLCIASGADDDVPASVTEALAREWDADLQLVHGASHVGPLLGHDAGRVASQVADWLEAGQP